VIETKVKNHLASLQYKIVNKMARE